MLSMTDIAKILFHRRLPHLALTADEAFDKALLPDAGNTVGGQIMHFANEAIGDATAVHNAMTAYAETASPPGIKRIDPIHHARRPETAGIERECLKSALNLEGHMGIVRTLMQYAFAQPTHGSFAGSLWAIAEWVHTHMDDAERKINHWDGAVTAHQNLVDRTIDDNEKLRAEVVQLRDSMLHLNNCYAARTEEAARVNEDAAKLRAEVERLRKEVDAAELRNVDTIIDLGLTEAGASLLRRRLEDTKTAIAEACDLLAERTYGNDARSPGHNARLRLEPAMRMLSHDELAEAQGFVPPTIISSRPLCSLCRKVIDGDKVKMTRWMHPECAAHQAQVSQAPSLQLREALRECIGCIDAAEGEGLHEVISELRAEGEGPDSWAGKLIDLIERRLLHVRVYAEAALNAATDTAPPSISPASLERLLATRPNSIFSRWHIANWSDSDFAQHTATMRKTLKWLFELEKGLVVLVNTPLAPTAEPSSDMPVTAAAPDAPRSGGRMPPFGSCS